MVATSAAAASRSANAAPAVTPPQATTFSTIPSAAGASSNSISTRDLPSDDRLTVSTIPAAASNWRPLTQSNDGCRLHWDPTTRVVRAGHRQAWFLVSCSATADSADAPPSFEILIDANCAARTIATAQSRSLTGLNGTGATGPTMRSALRPEDFAAAAAGTPGGVQLRALCAAPAKKRR